ncbi:hypothetical protein GUITHDRAFT_144091 [Guillardia theta CCMP2712]|uniref:Uncharacterized protein n=1 Tax=Guillardia theta (strain CCMP2712) TaxID=905079 RepID=L1IR17_GUITC|nr:hypothetical protein GUITHDRAFT_144091 [Guillardia theta CCMP2712]EKX38703.1 hypothetical protein GUITHDRAFT_144091 [Guillardia theta CCMP2712]|eukprot:XP_005825683.1 hypothetical protein GUITHDRAFT_144091 [Guillardia theta CCMP2712]
MAEKKKQREKNDKEKARKRTDFAKLLKPKVKEKILKYLRSLAPPLPDDIDSEEAKEFQLTDDELLGGLRDEVLNISSIEELDDTITSKKSQREYMIEKQQKIMKMPEAEEENIDKRIIKEAEEELEEESSNLDGEEDQDQDQDQNGNQSSDEVSSPSQQSSADNVGKKDVSSVSLQEDPDNPNRSANPFTAIPADDLFESDGESSRKIGSKRGPKLSRSQKKKKLTNSKTFYDNLDIERNL